MLSKREKDKSPSCLTGQLHLLGSQIWPLGSDPGYKAIARCFLGLEKGPLPLTFLKNVSFDPLRLALLFRRWPSQGLGAYFFWRGWFLLPEGAWEAAFKALRSANTWVLPLLVRSVPTFDSIFPDFFCTLIYFIGLVSCHAFHAMVSVTGQIQSVNDRIYKHYYTHPRPLLTSPPHSHFGMSERILFFGVR